MDNQYVYRHTTGYVGERYDYPHFDISEDFSSFDEACDALDAKLEKLHKDIGKSWRPRYKREDARSIVKEYIFILYDYFDNGTDCYKYFIRKHEKKTAVIPKSDE